MRWSLLILPAVLLVPIGDAFLGTEDLPELTDADEDVTYDPLHAGPRNSDHLDVVAAWFSHNATADDIHFTFKVTNATRYQSPPMDYRYDCTFRAIAESPTGQAALFFSFFNGLGRPMESAVAFDREGSSRYDADSPRLAHRIVVKQAGLGYIDFAVSRAAVLHFADRLSDLTADCYEDYQPGPVTLYTNSDAARSNGAYSVLEARRERGPDGHVDPVEAYERTQSAAPPSEAVASSDTPGVGALAGIIGVLAALVAFRRP